VSRALIISPTGCPIHTHEDYGRHWRLDGLDRSYDVALIVFNDFVPEPDTYDFLIQKKGLKFHLIKDVCDNVLRWEDYDYIGTWDDDYATDIQSVETALRIARQNDFRMFQQAMTSFNTYDCLKHDPKFEWTETNFIETGVPFFRNDYFKKLLNFLGDYRYKVSEWGIDKVLCDVLGGSAHVVHASTARHMRQESWYDKSDGFKEMAYLTEEFMPPYMEKKGFPNWKFRDEQRAFVGKLSEQRS
jgi:hypothetical protein